MQGYAQSSLSNTYSFWNPDMLAIAKPESRPGWIFFNDSLTTPANQIFVAHASAFGLGQNDEMVLKESYTDEFGINHLKFSRFNNGKLVFANEAIIHVNTIGKVSANLKIDVLNFNNNLDLQSYQVSLAEISAQFDSVQVANELYVESNGIFFLAKELKCFKAGLCIGSHFVSLNNGAKIIYISNELSCDNTNACTIQNGNQVVGLKAEGSNFKMENDCHSLDLVVKQNDIINLAWEDILISDPLDCSTDNAAKMNLMYSFKSAFEYYRSVHGLSGFVLPPVGSSITPHANTQVNYYHSSYTADCLAQFPLSGSSFSTSTRAVIEQDQSWGKGYPQAFFVEQAKSRIDVIAHEVTHTILANRGSNLWYVNESGALNESFADIFGTVIEFAELNNGGNWLFADNAYGANYPYSRNLGNPKDPLALIQQPNTYQGEYWYPVNCLHPELNDQCGVHTNSGVQNYWFYLLVNGGSGINDHNVSYNVQGIGLSKATTVAYQNMMNYLTLNSTYQDARNGSISAALNLIPSGVLDFCDLQQIKNAWDAVGVYEQNSNEILLTSSVNYVNQTLNFNSSLRVPFGITLSFDNCDVKLGPGVKIILEGGATLNISYSSLSSSGLVNCGEIDRWGGIVDLGENTITIQNSTIRDAYTAIDIALNQNSLISVSTTKFIDCKVGVMDRNVLFGNLPSSISFNYCLFQNSNLLSYQGNFQQQTFTPQPYQVLQNFLPSSITSWNGQSPNLGISYQSIDRSANKNIGIINPTYMVLSNCTFQNLDEGMKGLYNNDIGNNFNSLYFNACNKGLSLEGMHINSSGFSFSNLDLSGLFFNKTSKCVNVSNFNQVSIENVMIRNMPIATDEDVVGLHLKNINECQLQNDYFYGIQANIGNLNKSYAILVDNVGSLELNNEKMHSTDFGIKGVASEAFIQHSRFSKTKIGVQLEGGSLALVDNDFIDIRKTNSGNTIQNAYEKSYGVFFKNDLITANNNRFTNCDFGMYLLQSVTGSEIDDNDFTNVKKGIYMTGEGDIIANDFINIPPAIADNYPFTVDDTYGIFVTGAKPREIVMNTFNGSPSNNPGAASSYGAVIEATGSSAVLFFGNTTSGTDVGIQAEGINNNLGIFCNNFSRYGTAHPRGAFRLTPNTSQFTTFSTPAVLRHQGTNCDNSSNPAGNEWFDHTGNKDIVLVPTQYSIFASNPAQGISSNIPYFKYVAHAKDEDGSDRTVPQHNYAQWVTQPLGKEFKKCAVNSPAGNKDITSCAHVGFGPKMLNGGSGSLSLDGLNTISDLLSIKTSLETERTSLENQLTNPDTQKEEVIRLKEIELSLESVVLKLYDLYKRELTESDAKMLLETEDYEEVKKLLATIYYEEGNYAASRLAQDDLETLLLAKPDYYYNTLEEREAEELNDLYFKEINELLIQADESGRDENQLLSWELYALNLIKYTNLPVSAKAEKLLSINNQEIEEHPIEKVDETLLNYIESDILIDFNYNLYAIPNPAMHSTQVNIEIPDNIENAILLVADSYNNQGVLQNYSLNSGNNSVEVNVSNLTSGMYVLSIKINEEVYASTNLIVIH